ncbi:MAG: toxin-antitoxin system YwqK family antitoxin [Luteibaculum sp.]
MHTKNLLSLNIVFLSLLLSSNVFGQNKINCNMHQDSIMVYTKHNRDGYLEYVTRKVGDRFEGKQEYYYSNGEPKKVSHYRLGKLHGETRKWHSNGRLASVIEYEDGQEIGSYQLYYESGEPRQIATKTKDPEKPEKSVFDGKYRFYDQAGDIKYKGRFVKGKKDGRWQEWNKGKPYTDYRFEMGEKVGPFKEYHPDGSLRKKGRFIHPDQAQHKGHGSIYDGVIVSYFPDGTVEEKGGYRKGIPVGKHYKYYQDGLLSTLTNYPGDKRMEITNYYKGTEQKSYFKAYLLREENGYMKRIDDGPERRWSENGQLKGETNYTEGKKHGPVYSYYESGALAMEAHWENDIRVGSSRYYYENGQLDRLYSYELIRNGSDSKDHGWQKRFQENGDPIFIQYADTTFDKVMQRNYENGQIKSFYHHKLITLEFFHEGSLASIEFPSQNHGQALVLKYYMSGDLRAVDIQDPNQNKLLSHYFGANKTHTGVHHASNSSISVESGKEYVLKVVEKMGWDHPKIFGFHPKEINGPLTIISSRGDTLFRATFNKDLATGSSLLAHPLTGDTLMYCEMEKGLPIGLELQTFAGIRDKYRVQYNRDHEKIAYSNYNDEGIPHRKVYLNERNERIEEDFHPNGQLEYFKNKTTNEVIQYSDQGQKYYEYVRPNPDIDSLCYRQYFPESEKVKQMYFLIGKEKTGPYISFAENGDTTSYFTYSKNERHGKAFYYSKDRKERFSGSYKEGKQHGWWYTISEGKTDSLYYNQGKAQVYVPDVPCACADTSFTLGGKMAYRLNNVSEKEDFFKNIPLEISLGEDFDYDGLFYSRYTPSGNRSGRSAGFRLVTTDTLSFKVPVSQGIEVTLNPCQISPYLTELPGTMYRSTDFSILDVTLRPKRLGLTFKKGPLSRGNAPVLFRFNTESLRFRNNRGIEVEMDDDVQTCHNQIALGESFFLNDIELKEVWLSGIPSGALYGNDLRNLELTRSELSSFSGIWATKGKFDVTLGIKSKVRYLGAIENLLGGIDFVAGTIVIERIQFSGEKLLLQTDPDIEISEEELKQSLLAQGFDRIAIQTNREKRILKIYFYAK